MNDIIDFFVSDVKFTVSLILSAFSIFIAYMFYYKAINVKKPCFRNKSTNIISPYIFLDNPIKVLFLDEPVKSLTITRIVFWNNGRATINHSDIALADPLRITARNGNRILAVGILGNNKPGANFTVDLNNQNIATINFDYMDYSNGVVIQIYHTGSDEDELYVEGSLRGVDEIVNVEESIRRIARALDSFRDRYLGWVFNLEPGWLKKAREEAKTHQSFLRQFILDIPLYIIAFPFVVVYMAIVIPWFLFMLIKLPIVDSFYKIPKELYQPFMNEY